MALFLSQAETISFIARSEVYPIRAYDPPYKLFEADRNCKVGSQQVQNLALFKK